jgi:hypothetical protein
MSGVSFPAGRKADVLIEDITYLNTSTGRTAVVANGLIVWADQGLVDVIRNVEGVVSASPTPVFPTQYIVLIDPRYDREIMKKEIEAAILCRPEAKS